MSEINDESMHVIFKIVYFKISFLREDTRTNKLYRFEKQWRSKPNNWGAYVHIFVFTDHQNNRFERSINFQKTNITPIIKFAMQLSKKPAIFLPISVGLSIQIYCTNLSRLSFPYFITFQNKTLKFY